MAHTLAYLFNPTLYSVLKSGLPSFPFFTTLRMVIFLVRLAFMGISTVLWHRLTTNPHLDCPSLPPLSGVPEPSKRLSLALMYINSL